MAPWHQSKQTHHDRTPTHGWAARAHGPNGPWAGAHDFVQERGRGEARWPSMIPTHSPQQTVPRPVLCTIHHTSTPNTVRWACSENQSKRAMAAKIGRWVGVSDWPLHCPLVRVRVERQLPRTRPTTHQSAFRKAMRWNTEGNQARSLAVCCAA